MVLADQNLTKYELPAVNPSIIRCPLPPAKLFTQITEVNVPQEPLYTSIDILAMPEGTCTALLTRTMAEDELAVNVYQISSSAEEPMQVGAGREAVALTVVAAVEKVQAIPKGVVVMGIAPLQSSLAGAWETTIK